MAQNKLVLKRTYVQHHFQRRLCACKLQSCFWTNSFQLNGPQGLPVCII